MLMMRCMALRYYSALLYVSIVPWLEPADMISTGIWCDKLPEISSSALNSEISVYVQVGEVGLPSNESGVWFDLKLT